MRIFQLQWYSNKSRISIYVSRISMFLVNRKLFDILGSFIHLHSVLWYAANSGSSSALPRFLDISFIPRDFTCFIPINKQLWHSTSYLHSKWWTCVAFRYTGVRIIYANMGNVLMWHDVDGMHSIWCFYIGKWLVTRVRTMFY